MSSSHFPSVLYLPYEDVVKQRENYLRQRAANLARLRTIEDQLRRCDERLHTLENLRIRDANEKLSQYVVGYTKPINN